MRTFTANGNSVELFVPLAKFDERTGEFEAWSTIEEIDNHSEFCDVAQSWPALVQWSTEQLEYSQGKSAGNLRIQHDRTKIGGALKTMELAERDGSSGVHITGLITNTQAKIDAAAGAITGISIRGLAERWEDPERPGVMRYVWTMVEEKSLVDRPAVPHALIEVLKSNGGVQMVTAKGQPAQFWDCGITTCGAKHAKKEEAIKCDGAMPVRIEAKKSLWRVADLVSALTTLLYVLNDSEWEEAWRSLENVDVDLSIPDTLKESAQKLFDAIQAILADERVAAEIDTASESATTEGGDTAEMAMAATMRALAKSPTAKQLLKSLRVLNGNGSMKTKEEPNVDKKKADAPDVATELTKLTEAIEAMQKQVSEIDSRLKTIEDGAKPAASTDTAKALADLTTKVVDLGTRIEAAAKQPDARIDELAKSVTEIGEAFESLLGAFPMAPKGVVRIVDKEKDGGADTGKSAGDAKPENPWLTKVQRIA